MKTRMILSLIAPRRLLLAACLLLAGCLGGSLNGLGKYSRPSSGAGTGASLSVLNYTDKGYDWVGVASPEDPEHTTASDMGIRPYGGGGIVCCYRLPDKWRPGLKVVVQTKRDTEAKTIEEFDKENIPVISRTLDIPPYPDGKAGILWLQIMGPQDIRVTASDLDPAHPDWPGQVKGGPRPSLEYRRKRWDEDHKEYQRQLNRFLNAAKERPADAQKFLEAAEITQEQIKRLGARP